MPAVTIKNLSESLYAILRLRAKREGRSLNREVIHLLETAVGISQPGPEDLLERIQDARRRYPVPPMTEDWLLQAKGEGRP